MKIAHPGLALRVEPHGRAAPEQHGSHRNEREDEGQRGEEEGARHAGDEEAEQRDGRLGEGRADEAVDHALHRALRGGHERRTMVFAGEAANAFREEQAHLLAIAVEEEGDEEGHEDLARVLRRTPHPSRAHVLCGIDRALREPDQLLTASRSRWP
jgi:hypothetical protein